VWPICGCLWYFIPVSTGEKESLTHGYSSVGVFESLCHHMCNNGLLFENPPACFVNSMPRAIHVNPLYSCLNCYSYFILTYSEKDTKIKTKKDTDSSKTLVPVPELVKVTKDRKIPSELKCPMCQNLLNDAVLIPCCGTSYCDECKFSLGTLSTRTTRTTKFE